jgi:hypothetical protein
VCGGARRRSAGSSPASGQIDLSCTNFDRDCTKTKRRARGTHQGARRGGRGVGGGDRRDGSPMGGGAPARRWQRCARVGSGREKVRVGGELGATFIGWRRKGRGA